MCKGYNLTFIRNILCFRKSKIKVLKCAYEFVVLNQNNSILELKREGDHLAQLSPFIQGLEVLRKHFALSNMVVTSHI